MTFRGGPRIERPERPWCPRVPGSRVRMFTPHFSLVQDECMSFFSLIFLAVKQPRTTSASKSATNQVHYQNQRYGSVTRAHRVILLVKNHISDYYTPHHPTFRYSCGRVVSEQLVYLKYDIVENV